jgi:hypothetical protein
MERQKKCHSVYVILAQMNARIRDEMRIQKRIKAESAKKNQKAPTVIFELLRKSFVLDGSQAFMKKALTS